ncbi:MAG: GNAT family N-acetyltransferase [Rhodobacteraceae bacterium]|nr:GNAT family N-acetyltransferase [Paracoccaceae bacterium]
MIRRAKIRDVAELVACIDAAYDVARESGIDLPPVSEGLDQDIRDHLVWISVEESQTVGVIVVAINSDHAHLMNIAVHPSAGGKGIAKSLIECALEELRRLKVGRIELATHVDMPRNVSLYRHLGWAETGRSGNKVHMSRAII